MPIIVFVLRLTLSKNNKWKIPIKRINLCITSIANKAKLNSLLIKASWKERKVNMKKMRSIMIIRYKKFDKEFKTQNKWQRKCNKNTYRPTTAKSPTPSPNIRIIWNLLMRKKQYQNIIRALIT